MSNAPELLDLQTPGLKERIDALLAFLPVVESQTRPGRWGGGDRRPDGSITMPAFQADDWLLEFVKAAYEHEWVRAGFDWGTWYEREGNAQEASDVLERASVETVARLLTAHIRADRFVEGHLDAFVSSGLLEGILRRLAVIRGEIG